MPDFQFIRGRINWLKGSFSPGLNGRFVSALIRLRESLGFDREPWNALMDLRQVSHESQLDYLSLDRILATIKTGHFKRHATWALEKPPSPEREIGACHELAQVNRHKQRL